MLKQQHRSGLALDLLASSDPITWFVTFALVLSASPPWLCCFYCFLARPSVHLSPSSPRSRSSPNPTQVELLLSFLGPRNRNSLLLGSLFAISIDTISFVLSLRHSFGPLGSASLDRPTFALPLRIGQLGPRPYGSVSTDQLLRNGPLGSDRRLWIGQLRSSHCVCPSRLGPHGLTPSDPLERSPRISQIGPALWLANSARPPRLGSFHSDSSARLLPFGPLGSTPITLGPLNSALSDPRK